jgi:superfamily II DNA/RNA helicase
MDLPDIEIVVQWKATCDLCTLWQRFGRVARSQGKEGVAILLVEKKDTNEERAAKVERAAKWKKKVSEGIGTGRKRKAVRQGGRMVLADFSLNQEMAAPIVPINLVKAAEIAFLEERQVHFAHREKSSHGRFEPPKGKVRPDIEVGSAMDDFINPPDGVKCRRVVPTLFFQNDKTHESRFLQSSTRFSCISCIPHSNRRLQALRPSKSFWLYTLCA